MSKKYNNSFSVGLAPKNGIPGESGPMPVPSGFYDPDTEYIRTKAQAPIVMSRENGKYYLLEKFGITKGVDPVTDSSGTWALFDHLQYVFAEIIMANYAKIAGGVHYDDKLMSQYGKEGNEENSNYENYTGEGGSWQPNILLDFLTGKVRFNIAEIIGNIKAGSGNIGSFTIQNGNLVSDYYFGHTVNGIYMIVHGGITLNDREIKLSDSFGGVVGYPQVHTRSISFKATDITIKTEITGFPNPSETILEIRSSGIYRDGVQIL
jgi:hypothetical protein